MSDAVNDGDELAPESSSVSDRLMTGWERALACLFGFGIAGAGGVAVFVSSNQAGTTSLVLIGAVFLLIGIQGTPIAKATKDSIELRARRVAKKAKELAKEGRADDAEGFIEGAIVAEPRLLKVEQVSRMGRDLFELSVEHVMMGHRALAGFA
ncbi:hypothetical protein [Amycolatopsis sp. Hca4]|uniref:hypothetical protein n=1 Tax=Amycolatopsis sp. Hca4 TaxID=2742131 RepID=UPI001591F2F0|nr:hypothetical protein [Amycolatopsis sp. Hca4]QKV77086.1 hypothetical protein HUT10_27385 [Amycolatopsis sp. Hca4]